MSGMQPMAMYGLEVPCGDVAISARPDIPSAFRITMAAIDPSAEPEGEEGAPPRATLKVIRQALIDEEDEFDDDSDDGFDTEEMERILAEEASDESDEDDEEVNGGPSDPAKSKKAKRAAAEKEIMKLLAKEGMDIDEDEDEDEDDKQPNGVDGINGHSKSAKSKGKMPASDSDEDEDDMDDMDLDSEDVEVEEFVICTLDPSKLYQQTLDITFGEDERVWFKVSGTHSIFLTGNYVEPVGGADGMYDPDSDEEEEYDLEPDMDEIDDEDELDDMEDPRITELDDEEAPKLIQAKPKIEAKVAKANKNKRSAPESADEDEADAGAEGLDEIMAKEATAKPTVNGEAKLTNKQKKKLKKNDGLAAAAPAAVKAGDVEPPSSQKFDKKVQFAKELEQGPTPTKAPEKSADATKAKSASGLGPKTIQGVIVDDKKIGEGRAAKSGDRVSMRYIGKLKDTGKMFDSNKKGKPFGFKLGSGEVIKGWDIGVKGMQVGGERRITVPAHLAYGSKNMGDIPANSTLVFDIKCLELK